MAKSPKKRARTVQQATPTRRSSRLSASPTKDGSATSVGSGSGDSAAVQPSPKKRQRRVKNAAEEAKTDAEAGAEATKTDAPALKKSASLKKSPSLKRSSSVASLPEGWVPTEPMVDHSNEEMLESVTAAIKGTKCYGSEQFRVVCWNVNGLNTFIKKSSPYLSKYLDVELPDVLCLNETKLTADKALKFEDKIPGYTVHFHCADKKGYSGTAIAVRNDGAAAGCTKVTTGLGSHYNDKEGRVMTLELPKAFVVVAYVPNSGMKLDRLEYRTKTWDPAFKAYLDELLKSKDVIVVGDLNVAHSEQDLAKPKTNRNKSPGFCDGERDNLSALLEGSGFTDTWRDANPTRQCFSYFSYRFQCRAKNLGWRLDYALVSPKLHSQVLDSFIRQDMLGSDHVPFGVALEKDAVV